jgi:ureidoacrylate peracid hydrolase
MHLPVSVPASEPVLLKTEPTPVEIDLRRMAVLVIDMQNCFVSRGGYFDLMGFDISASQRVIEPIREILGVARQKGIRVIHVVHHYSPDLRETGGQNSGNWYRNHLVMYRAHPEWAHTFFVRGTWGAEIVDGLKPEGGEIVVAKPRYSAFFGTDLDTILRTFDIKYLFFTGVDTAICVESSVRDGYNLDYFPFIISDATACSGPSFVREATLLNVKHCFGWVIERGQLIAAIEK